MADYLSDLAAGLGEAPGFLRPRQTSLFEPTDASRSPVAAGDSTAQEQDVFQESNRSELPRPRDATESVFDRTQRPGRDDISLRNFDDRPWRAAEARNADGDRLAATEPEKHESRPRADAADRAAAKSTEVMSPFEDMTEKPKARARPQGQAADESERSESSPRWAVDMPNALSPRPETAIPRPDTRSPTAGVYQPPPARESPMRPRTEAQDAAERRQREPVEPTIHITIGRVEVRATQEAEPRGRKKEEPSRVMTLGEYLQKRAK